MKTGPLPSRTYPVGRVVRTHDGGGVRVQYYLVRRSIARALGSPRPGCWKNGSPIRACRRILPPETGIRVCWPGKKPRAAPYRKTRRDCWCVALYQQDKFLEFIQHTGLLSKLDMPPQREEAVLTDDEERLDFALDWLELVLFDEAPGLRRK